MTRDGCRVDIRVLEWRWCERLHMLLGWVHSLVLCWLLVGSVLSVIIVLVWEECLILGVR